MSTTPCTECRRRRKRCVWATTQKQSEDNAAACLICVKQGRRCSGPVPLREGPCNSCKRSKVRCIWTHGDRCERCIEHGSDVCPMPARKRLSRSPQDLDRQVASSSSSVALVPRLSTDLSPYSPRSVSFAEITYLNSAIHALAHMKSIRLHMEGPPYMRKDTESQQALDAFCESLAEVAGLMFTELQTPDPSERSSIGAATDVQAVISSPTSSDIMSTGESNFEPVLTSVRRVTRATWSQLRSVRRDRKALANRDWWLKFSSALRLLRALRLVPDSDADRELLRVCLTETGVQCLEYAAEPTSSEEEGAGLRMVARSLMVEEANLACALRKSSLFPDMSASATLPSLIRVGSWDELSLEVNRDTVKTILLPPATCCISRTAHALAANHYSTLEALLVALSELRTAHEHARRLSEAMVYAEGPPSDPGSRDMARSVIKTELWALETWTNLLVKVKDVADGWPERSAWLAAQVSDVQAYIAEACDRLLSMFDRFSDLYQGCDTARAIIELHVNEFPDSCMLPGSPITNRLLQVAELSSVWNSKAIEMPNGQMIRSQARSTVELEVP